MFNSRSVSKILIWPVFILSVVLAGCSSTSELFSEDPTNETVNLDYSVIYYIHADSDYLYHDADGDPVRANSKVLETARSVAEELKSGELFIFYQRPEKKFLGLFPRNKSRLYHYRNGKLTSRIKYRHSDKSEDFLTTEARLYDQYRTRSGSENHRNYFLYFGHEIPDDDGINYHRTNPDIAVNTGSFSAGIRKFLVQGEAQFDLVVLSTCNNGTPEMAENLMPFSNTLLASPQNLHLSHIDTERLDLLESEPGITSNQIAQAMADQTYGRLESEIETTITLAVYDFGVIEEFKDELHTFSMKYDALDTRRFFSDNVDCNRVAFFEDDKFGKGVETWYKPARFGRISSTSTHSGWGCKPLIEN
ncbi:hypothetical protein [Rhodohalobacter sp.]|uniref:hypothetical protein n=1 Tax=Rhodohalobacter sp. TaxID=1974210 RepID=UPI002ACEBBFB|nr:hypothetical protein [Rhodohalobacter sp.]MDZ7755823.1 hypothetical protein [Rhodohalobacter sp.]